MRAPVHYFAPARRILSVGTTPHPHTFFVVHVCGMSRGSEFFHFRKGWVSVDVEGFTVVVDQTSTMYQTKTIKKLVTN